jgi:hypothetical protein
MVKVPCFDCDQAGCEKCGGSGYLLKKVPDAKS